MKFEFDGENQILIVDGVKIGFAYLAAIVNPDPNMVHRFQRRGNNVHVTSHLSLTEFLPGGAVN